MDGLFEDVHFLDIEIDQSISLYKVSNVIDSSKDALQ